MFMAQKNNGLFLRGKTASRFLFALALTIALLTVFAPDTAMAATVTLPAGEYKITYDGSNVVLTDNNGAVISQILDAATDIEVSGDLVLTVNTANADVTLNSIYVDGHLTISVNGSNFTVNNTTGVHDGYGVYAVTGLTIEAEGSSSSTYTVPLLTILIVVIVVQSVRGGKAEK